MVRKTFDAVGVGCYRNRVPEGVKMGGRHAEFHVLSRFEALPGAVLKYRNYLKELDIIHEQATH